MPPIPPAPVKRPPARPLRSRPSRVRTLDLFRSDGLELATNCPDAGILSRRGLNEKPLATASKYHLDFEEVCVLGQGEFGVVHKCVSRSDGCTYAVKRSLRPVTGRERKLATTEVEQHTSLGSHPNVLRLHSNWYENDYHFTQLEYVKGGNLAKAIETNKKLGRSFQESDLMKMLRQLAGGLRHMHSHNLVHLDMKPENILVAAEETSYKIADMGHMVSVHSTDVEEGDSRYLPMEILQEDVRNLRAADIFSLGLTIFEAAGGGPLPKNGDEWQQIRQGKLEYLSLYTEEFNYFLSRMVTPNPDDRPTAEELLRSAEFYLFM